MHDFAFALPTLLILAPAATGLICMSMPSVRGGAWTSLLGFLVQTALLVLGIAILAGHTTSHVQLTESTTWFRQWHVNYAVQLTQVPAVLGCLAVLVTFCATMFTRYANRDRGHVLQGLLWLTLAALTGLFLSRDLVVFYTFFELMLVPLFFALGGWGGANAVRATVIMFIYTLTGSLLMLVGVIAVGVRAHTFDLTKLAAAGAHGAFPWWMMLTFVVAFAVKAPLFGVHGWMPISYREAPAEVAAVLSGLISKAAFFGFLAVVLPLFPTFIAGTWGKALIWLAVGGLLYASVAAFRQRDARGVVAYSSLAQMSLIVLGLLVVAGPGGIQGINGALLQAVNHGLISAALFLTIGVIEHRLQSDSRFAGLGGLGVGRPVFYTLTLIVTMCTLAVPGSNAFGGELLIFAAAFRGPWVHAWIWASVASVGVVLAAMYALRLFSAVMHTPGRTHGPLELGGAETEPGHSEEGDEHTHGGGEQPQSVASKRFGGDLRWGEALAIVPIVLALLVLSAWPNALHGAYHHPTPVTTAVTASGSNP